MKDILGQVMDLKRPIMLVSAARYGIDDYKRERHLQRCLGGEKTRSPGQALVALLDLEKQLNAERETKSRVYVAARHIEILVAIMAEAKLLRAITTPKLQSVSCDPQST